MSRYSAQQSSISENNRSRILQYLYHNGICSRAQIAKAIKLTPAAITKITAKLLAQGIIDETGDMDDAALMAALGHPGQHPEGRFLPETYAYQRGDSDLDILRRAHVAMAQALDEAWQARADDVPLATPDEALVLASIVEKET